ncbi:MAG: DUF3078 domain-containing protein [Bacteroidales bacterium]|jgi:hypothetical protein|nr:DUF3078 domain-containing protein [Bacteroidales bacterium]
MKKNYLIFLLLSLGFLLQAQTDTTKNWQVKQNISINFSQSYFTNWSAGGVNTLATAGKYTFNADYVKGKQNWTNWVNLALGYSVTGSNKAVKTDDKIEFISTYGYKLKKSWFATMMLSFKSQFAHGFDYKVDSSTYISKFMAPGTIDLGPGIEYEPNEHFLVNFSPASMRWIIVNDERLADAGSFGLAPAKRDTNGLILEHAKKVKTMFGAKMLMAFKYEIFKNVNFSTKLELYSDYLNNPQNIDVNWQTAFILKVNSWLNINISSELLYDDSVIFYEYDGSDKGPRTQFNENIMLGIGFSF